MATTMYVPGQKMDGFGGGSNQSSTNKPKTAFKAFSSFASTAFDAIKPADHPDKKGATTGDARRAAADVFWTMSGNCKVTGSVMTVEQRMACGCVGCASWDNEKIHRQYEQQAKDEKMQEEQMKRAAAMQAERASSSQPTGGYQAPSAAVHPSSSYTAASSTYIATQAPRAPWGPTSQAAQKQHVAPGLREEPMTPVMDLMGMSAPTAPAADLLGDSGSSGPVNAAGGFDLLGDAPVASASSATTAPVVDLLDVAGDSPAASGAFDPFAPPAQAAAAPSSAFGFIGNARPASTVQQPASFDPFAAPASTTQASTASPTSSMFAGMSVSAGAAAPATNNTFMMMG